MFYFVLTDVLDGLNNSVETGLALKFFHITLLKSKQPISTAFGLLTIYIPFSAVDILQVIYTD